MHRGWIPIPGPRFSTGAGFLCSGTTGSPGNVIREDRESTWLGVNSASQSCCCSWIQGKSDMASFSKGRPIHLSTIKEIVLGLPWWPSGRESAWQCRVRSLDWEDSTFLGASRPELLNLCSQFSSVQFSFSVVSDSCNPMNCRMPGLPVHHKLSEPTQTHGCWVSDTIPASHPLSSPSPPALNLSQNQSLFKWVSSLHQVAKVLEFQLQHQSFQWTPRTDLF